MPPRRANPAAITTEEDDLPSNWRSFSSSRIAEAAYDPGTERLFVRWVKPGRPYVYNGVSRNEWRNFRRAKSAGKYVNRILNSKDYSPGDF